MENSLPASKQPTLHKIFEWTHVLEPAGLLVDPQLDVGAAVPQHLTVLVLPVVCQA